MFYHPRNKWVVPRGLYWAALQAMRQAQHWLGRGRQVLNSKIPVWGCRSWTCMNRPLPLQSRRSTPHKLSAVHRYGASQEGIKVLDVQLTAQATLRSAAGTAGCSFAGQS